MPEGCLYFGGTGYGLSAKPYRITCSHLQVWQKPGQIQPSPCAIEECNRVRLWCVKALLHSDSGHRIEFPVDKQILRIRALVALANFITRYEQQVDTIEREIVPDNDTREK